jgi:antirestriction protein ArdC
MRQANDLGGNIRKGEESTIIVFWKVEDRRGEDQDLSDAKSDDECRRRFVLRYYRVWNVEQCELTVIRELPESNDSMPFAAFLLLAVSILESRLRFHTSCVAN